jgi:carbonic anhydrase
MNGPDAKQRLMDGNALFRKSVDPAVFTRLNTKAQEPFIAILSCSDSRVDPVKIFNLSMGDAFVVRIVGNSASDPLVIGSLEYAVEHLHVKMLLVMGHTGCGAVKAMMDGNAPEGLDKVMNDMERARDKVPADRARNVDAIAESNVRFQMRVIEDTSVPIAKAVNQGTLQLAGAMYDLATGSVRFL